MTSNPRLWAPFAARFTLGFAAASVAMLALAPRAKAQTANKNKMAVEAKFEAWKAGTGNPFELLADEASWTIEGNSLASKRYPTKETFLAEVIRPFNARMSVGIKPVVRSITAEADRVVEANAFFDAIAFNDLWARVTPTE